MNSPSTQLTSKRRLFSRFLAGLFYQVKFYLCQRWRYNRHTFEDVNGIPFILLPTVFNPKILLTGEIFARSLDSLKLPDECSVLDLGTGSGVAAVFAARKGARVTAVDINPDAVRCAKLNALLHNLEDRVEVLQGDLYEPVRGRQFDLVLFHPPFFRGKPIDEMDCAWRFGDVPKRFASGLMEHLAKGGSALVMLSTAGNCSDYLQSFYNEGFKMDVVFESDIIVETLKTYRIHKR